MTTIVNKFGVPLASGRNATITQPKVKNKFRVVFDYFGTDSDEEDYITLDVDSITRPKLQFNANQLHHFTTNTTYIGKHNWEPITLVFRDSINNKSAKVLYKQLQKQKDFARRLSPRDAQKNIRTTAYKFNMGIEITGGANPEDSFSNFGRGLAVDVGTAITNNPGLVNTVNTALGGNKNPLSLIEYWVCYGCVITDVDYDKLTYDSSEYVTITLTIKPDNCVQYDTIEEMYGTRILPFGGFGSAVNVLDKVIGGIVF